MGMFKDAAIGTVAKLVGFFMFMACGLFFFLILMQPAIGGDELSKTIAAGLFAGLTLLGIILFAYGQKLAG